VASRAPVTPLHRLRLFFIFFYFSNLFPIYTKRRFVVVFAPMEQLMCIALAIYFEARGESSLGQWAVGNVVLNRVRDPRYPSDACAVREARAVVRGSACTPQVPILILLRW
jgi:hypothetical protein